MNHQWHPFHHDVMLVQLFSKWTPSQLTTLRRRLSVPCASRCSVCGRVGRKTEAGMQRWHQAGSRQRGTEAATRSDGENGGVAERNRRQLDPRRALLLDPLHLLLLCSPGTTNTFANRMKKYKYVLICGTAGRETWQPGFVSINSSLSLLLSCFTICSTVKWFLANVLQ